MRAALLFLLLLALLAAAAEGLRRGLITLPPEWNPWAPLSIQAPPNLLTGFKLMRASRDDALCQAVLSEAPMRYERLPDRQTGEGCGFENAVRIHETSLRVGAPFSLSCRAALSLALWEAHVLQPAAQAHFGVAAAQLEHFGSYACRNLYGREEGRRSQHATADALDLAGIVLADGRRIRVVRDWKGPESQDPEARFLREIHQGACRFFSAVLGPDYNAAHRDHLHFDRGSFRICR